MEKDVEKYCKSCYGCQLVSRPDPVEPIRTTSLPSSPWRDLAVGLLGPLPTGDSILVVIDYYIFNSLYSVQVWLYCTTIFRLLYIEFRLLY